MTLFGFEGKFSLRCSLASLPLCDLQFPGGHILLIVSKLLPAANY